MRRPTKRSTILSGLYPSSLFWILLAIFLANILFLDGNMRFIPLLFLFILAAIGKCFKDFAGRFFKLSLLCIFIFIIQGTAFGDTEVFRIWFFSFRYEGILRSREFIFFILGIGGTLILFFTIVSINDVTYALRKVGIPYSAAYIFLLTMEMIPALGRKARVIMAAQRSRGIEVEGNIFVRLRAYIPMLGPLLLSSIIATEEKALTLEARGFSVKGKKTFLYTLEKSRWDHLIFIFCIFTIIVSIFIRFFL